MRLNFFVTLLILGLPVLAHGDLVLSLNLNAPDHAVMQGYTGVADVNLESVPTTDDLQVRGVTLNLHVEPVGALRFKGSSPKSSVFGFLNSVAEVKEGELYTVSGSNFLDPWPAANETLFKLDYQIAENAPPGKYDVSLNVQDFIKVPSAGDPDQNLGASFVTGENATGDSLTAVPEPATLGLLLVSMAGLGLIVWRRRKSV